MKKYLITRIQNKITRIFNYGLRKNRSGIICVIGLSLCNLVVYFSVVTSLCYASFEDIGWGVRPLGMSNTFTGLADDVHSIFYNPAGLGKMGYIEFTTAYRQLYINLDDDSRLGTGVIGYAHPFGKFGTFGLGWTNFTLANTYQENSIYFSYGISISSWLAVGLSNRVLFIGYQQDDYTRGDRVFEYGKKNIAGGYALDLGALFRFNPNFALGLNFVNINQPSIALSDKDILKPALRIGLGYKDTSVNSGIDIFWAQKKFKATTGIELWLGKHFILRGGIGIGTNYWRQLTIGFGYAQSLFSIDYVFVYPLFGIEDTAGTHSLALNLHFGRITPIEERIKSYFNLAMDFFNQGEYESAIIEFQRVLKLDPLYWDAQKKIADSRTKIKERYEVLEEKIKKAEEAVYEAERAAKQAAGAAERADKTVTEIDRRVKETPKPEKPKFYVIMPGDTLESIAEKLYGSTEKWTELYQLNEEKIKKGTLVPGEVLILP